MAVNEVKISEKRLGVAYYCSVSLLEYRGSLFKTL